MTIAAEFAKLSIRKAMLVISTWLVAHYVCILAQHEQTCDTCGIRNLESKQNI